jgi:exopolysaccharide biosynthesis protein
MLRLDLDYFRLDIAYHEIPQTLEDWQTETNALVVVNGGYFRRENDRYFPNGLTIVDGEPIGSSYDDFAGMLAIDDDGAELRWLADTPYDPSEVLTAAMQSFPILVKPGGELGFQEQHEDNLQARRTVVGQDKDGRMLFIVAPRGYFTLHQLSAFLTESDLDLDIAINLDGGPSSGILVANPHQVIPALTFLPLVILVYAR